MIIETHCHLTADRFNDDRDEVIQRMRDAGILRAITVGTGIEDAKDCAELANKHSDLLSCSAGIDPFHAFDAGDAFPDHLQELDELLTTKQFCALGEIGLDYHYDLDPKPIQAQRFRAQLELAEKHNLPVIIHVRDAHEDMLKILNEHPKNRGVIHSFTGTRTESERYLALDNWMLSFNGICTFKNATDVAEAAAYCPADRILVETDSPYLAPVPLRGKRCEPAFITHTIDFIAEQRGERADDLTGWTCKNACALFGFTGIWEVPIEPWKQVDWS